MENLRYATAFLNLLLVLVIAFSAITADVTAPNPLDKYDSPQENYFDKYDPPQENPFDKYDPPQKNPFDEPYTPKSQQSTAPKNPYDEFDPPPPAPPGWEWKKVPTSANKNSLNHWLAIGAIMCLSVVYTFLLVQPNFKKLLLKPWMIKLVETSRYCAAFLNLILFATVLLTFSHEGFRTDLQGLPCLILLLLVPLNVYVLIQANVKKALPDW